jgi:hypothetical protein
LTGYESSAIRCDSIDKTSLAIVNSVAVTFPTDLYASATSLQSIDLKGAYYGDASVVSSYRGQQIVTRKVLDAAADEVKLYVYSLDGPGYLYPVY